MWPPLIEAWYRVTASMRRRRLERDLDDEIAFHLAMRESDSAAASASAADARRDAERRFGNVTGLKEQMREIWTFGSLDSAWQDVKYAGRTLHRQPGFTSVAVMVLATVIGLNTSLFTVFSALTFHAPTGIKEPGRVVSLFPVVPQGEPAFFSVAEYRFLADHVSTLKVSAIGGGGQISVGLKGAQGMASAMLVSGNFFETLGVAIGRGRGVGIDDDWPDRPKAIVVLGSRLWENRFGGDPDIVGRSLLLNQVPFTVVGIASRDFIGLEPAVGQNPALFLPISAFSLARPELAAAGSLGFVNIVGRLAPGATREQARTESDLLIRRYDLTARVDARPVVATDLAFLSHPGRRVILVFLGLISLALMLVWLLACANVGNLLLARAAARRHEIAVRLSLGADRWRVVRQLLTEGFLLALVAGALGVVIAWTLPTLLLRVVGDRAAVEALNFSLAPDGSVLGYAVLLAAASALAFGLAPALHVTRSDVANALKDRGGLPPSQFRLRGALLAVQVAVSVIVLVGAGLLVRRVQRQASFDPGFPIDDVSVVTFMPRGNAYFEAAPRNAFLADLTESLRQSSFGAFGFSSGDPFSFGASIAFRLPGETPAESRRINYLDVSPGYLETLHISIVAGRSIDRADATRPIALINETMARKYWPNDNPIGKTFVAGQSETREIVGIVHNVSDGLDEIHSMFYQPLGSSASGGGIEISNGRQVVTDGGPLPLLFVRATGAGVAEEIARAVSRIDARMRVQTRPLTALLEDRQKAFRVGPILAALLGTFALVLATVGMFGVFAYAVRQRTREIGIRMALGAQPADVVRLILAGHSRAVLAGLAVGFVGSLGTSQIIRSFAYGVRPLDPITYLWVAALLAAAGFAASFVPARRATRINPIEALRFD